MRTIKSGLAAVLAAALISACGGSPTKESTGEYIDDTAITTKVMAAFVNDKEVKATEIKVDTFKGNVQLSGFASNSTEIERAAQLAGQVPGVKSVRNDIRLKPQ
jgi:osmotically-inducible protein OsmY